MVLDVFLIHELTFQKSLKVIGNVIIRHHIYRSVLRLMIKICSWLPHFRINRQHPSSIYSPRVGAENLFL